MRHGVNNPANSCFLHPGSNERHKLSGKEQPVITVSESAECGYIHLLLAGNLGNIERHLIICNPPFQLAEKSFQMVAI